MLHVKDLCLHGNNVIVFFFSGGKHQLQSVQQIMAFSIHTHLLTHMHACMHIHPKAVLVYDIPNQYPLTIVLMYLFSFL